MLVSLPHLRHPFKPLRALTVVGALTLALGSWTAAEMAQHNVAARVAAALPDMLQEPNQVCGGIRAGDSVDLGSGIRAMGLCW